MIKGLYSGYQGKIYIYYKGPVQVVLSDVHGGFNMGESELASTSLRIVLRPKQWTECAYSYVSEGFDSKKGQLYALEQSGMVDIYTDPAEVEALKQGKTALPVQPQTETKVVSDLPAAPSKQYFNMQMFTNTDQAAVQQPVQRQDTTNEALSSLQRQSELMQKQMEAMTKMTEAFTNMMTKFSDRLDKEH